VLVFSVCCVVSDVFWVAGGVKVISGGALAAL